MYLTTNEAEQLLNQPARTIELLVTRGLIRPCVQGGGRGKSHRFNMVDVLALGMYFGLRGNGMSVETASRVAAVIQRKSESELIANFEHGCTCLMIAGGRVMPEFLPPAAIVENEQIKKIGMARGVSVAALNVEPPYRKLVALAQQMQEKARKETTRSVAAAEMN